MNESGTQRSVPPLSVHSFENVTLTENERDDIADVFIISLYQRFRDENPDIHSLPQLHRLMKEVMVQRLQGYALTIQDSYPETSTAKETTLVSKNMHRLARTLVGHFLRFTTGMVGQEGGGTPSKSSTYADVLERLKTHTAFDNLICNFSRILRHYCYNTMATIGATCSKAPTHPLLSPISQSHSRWSSLWTGIPVRSSRISTKLALRKS